MSSCIGKTMHRQAGTPTLQHAPGASRAQSWAHLHPRRRRETGSAARCVLGRRRSGWAGQKSQRPACEGGYGGRPGAHRAPYQRMILPQVAVLAVIQVSSQQLKTAPPCPSANSGRHSVQQVQGARTLCSHEADAAPRLQAAIQVGLRPNGGRYAMA